MVCRTGCTSGSWSRRGEKATPYQDPRVTIGGATIVIIAEFKTPLCTRELLWVSIFSRPMCGAATPMFRIPKLNTHSKLNCIFACIQAAKAGVDEALMLDPHGFVATCNSTHFFIIRQGEVWTSSGDFCLDGITRRNVIDCCKRNGIPVYEKNFTLADVYAAEEAFVTGTFAGLTAVRQVDGRLIGNGEVYPQLGQLQGLYIDMIESEASE